MSKLTKEEKEKLLAGIQEGEKIEKEVSFSWDGKNLYVRFPKDIANYFGITKEKRFEKNIKFLVEEKQGEVIKQFDIIDRTKPKKIKKGKNATKTTKKTKDNKI